MSLSLLLLGLPLAFVMILMGFAKFQALPASLAVANHVGVAQSLWRWWGLLDLICAAGLTLGAFASASLALCAAAVSAVTLAALLMLQLRSRAPVGLLVPVLLLTLLAVSCAVAAALQL